MQHFSTLLFSYQVCIIHARRFAGALAGAYFSSALIEAKQRSLQYKQHTFRAN
jgi:hypothetical protein